MNNQVAELEIEYDNLYEKIIELDSVINSPLYEKFYPQIKSWMEIQLKAMEAYLICLSNRINYLKQY
jgi:hypothetical protein